MTYPEQKHPDAVIKMLCELASEHGYGLVYAEIVNTQSVLYGALPRYAYGEDFFKRHEGEKRDFGDPRARGADEA